MNKNSDFLVGFDNKMHDFTGFRHENLLQPIFRKGKLVSETPTLDAIRNRTLAQIEAFKGVSDYAIGLEKNLHLQKEEIIQKTRF
jgi:nicotinate phosphoribosyltransferase